MIYQNHWSVVNKFLAWLNIEVDGNVSLRQVVIGEIGQT